MIKQKICIIGNGLTGLTAALILGKLNLDVHLIAAPDKKRRRDIRTTAISESNYKGLIGFIGKKKFENLFWIQGNRSLQRTFQRDQTLYEFIK